MAYVAAILQLLMMLYYIFGFLTQKTWNAIRCSCYFGEIGIAWVLWLLLIEPEEALRLDDVRIPYQKSDLRELRG